MTGGTSHAPARAVRRLRVGAVLVALVLVAALGVVLGRPHVPATRSAGAVRARAVPAPAGRTAAVEALLRGRARAVLARDRAAFLAGVDPQRPQFRVHQAAVFDALAQVPLSAWTYTLDPLRARPPDTALDRRYGTWWAPRVVLGVGLAGIDADPAESDQPLTFAQRDGRWFVADDEDLAGPGTTTHQLWDEGPVVAVRGAHSLVLGHPGDPTRLRRLATDVDAAVGRVTAVWGHGWTQQVAVVVPADAAELRRLVTSRGSLAPIAALTVAAPVRGGTALGGDRVLIDPPALARLGETGRRVVLTHEVLHVAARAATSDVTPAWLSEGLADHVGFLGAGVPVPVAAQELRDRVRRQGVPPALPGDADFDGDRPDLAEVYEQAWLAVELLVRDHGQDRVLALYRDLGGRGGTDPSGALADALRSRLGITLPQVTAAWQADLRRQLA